MGHYEERLERDLTAIRERVVRLGDVLDRAVADATLSFLARDRALAAKTILGDMPVNRETRRIDRLCHVFVARHLPSAGILRTISAVLRISTGLERVGDYAAAVAREAVQMTIDPPAIVTRDIEMMSEQARSMLRQSIRAFEEGSADLARGTKEMERQSDSVYRKVYRDLLAEAERREVPVRDLFRILVVFNRLERIPDQAKNVCEETIFAVTGEMKPPKRYRILFLDEHNAGASVMARAIAGKAWPDICRYESAGWQPLDALDEGFVEFMYRQGHDVRDIRPRSLETDYEDLREFHVIVALEPGAAERIPEIPYSTVLLDWSEQLAGVGPRGELDDSHREALYKRLAPLIGDLVENLHGERAG